VLKMLVLVAPNIWSLLYITDFVIARTLFLYPCFAIILVNLWNLQFCFGGILNIMYIDYTLFQIHSHSVSLDFSSQMFSNNFLLKSKIAKLCFMVEIFALTMHSLSFIRKSVDSPQFQKLKYLNLIKYTLKNLKVKKINIYIQMQKVSKDLSCFKFGVLQRKL